MLKYNFHIALLTIIFGLVSCIEPLNWTEEITPSESLVVEGQITTEKGPHHIYLRRTQSVIAEGPGPGVDGAEVFIYCDTDTFEVVGEGSGIYSTAPEARAISGKTYHLQIILDGELYEASAEVIPTIPLDSIEIRPWAGDPNNQEGIQYFEFTYRPNFGTPRAYEYSISLEIPQNVKDFYPDDWEAPKWIDRVLNTTDRVLRDTSYYMHPGLEPPALFSSGESTYAGFTYGTIIEEKFFSISPAHYQFIRAVAAESDWRGLGPFGYIPANVPTNISNGGLGWFSASDVAIVRRIVL